MVEVLCGFNSTPDGHGADFLIFMGPTLMVEVGFDPAWRPEQLPTPPSLGGNPIRALVDTGATQSCIDQLLAASLGLPVVDRQPIAGSNGRHVANVYMAQMHVPSLGFTQYGLFAGVDLQAGGQPHQALIGRSFLRAFELHYEGHSGTVRLVRVDQTAGPSTA
jgi:hypothetical protein